ncbi:MAG: phenylalanine--tRNA ligase subunit beta [Gammaproteobacteria bacterium]|nr:phenylalanine--tRNA ligase subunit beta [Gammaproteobacteria bacterium]MCY4340361.1 phenylalanine--tRNA ligase subunit beta [Gammaproteobacteria bacterium]
MKIDLEWLREWCDPQVGEQVLADRLTMAGLEVDRISRSEHGSAVLELALTPNRADCFSVRGVAREVAALFRAKLSARLPPAAPAACDARRELRLDAPEGCPRFAGRVIEDLQGGAATPDFIARRLVSAGVRPLHLLVDVTNYVMLELGQPMHAYDLARLNGNLCARWARQGETLTLLDGTEAALDSDVLVIADEHQAVAAAGIMGGLSSAVSDRTRAVLLESAFFAPAAVAGRARRLGLQTEASLRFERGVDPTGQAEALELATELIAGAAGGRAGPVVDSKDGARLPQREPIRLRRDRLAALLGLALPDTEVAAMLRGLGMKVRMLKKGWRVTPPSFRFDLDREIDLVEEIARVHGYENIPETPARWSAHPAPSSERQVDVDRIRALLVDRGYCECINYSFLDKETHQAFHAGAPELELANPLSSELSVLRGSLWPGLLRNWRDNRDRGMPRARLFEVGICFSGQANEIIEEKWIAGLLSGDAVPEQWGEGKRRTDFFDARSDVEAMLCLSSFADRFRLEAAPHKTLRPGRSVRILRDAEEIGWLGELHPRLADGGKETMPKVFALRLDALRESRPAEAVRTSRFPSSRRDLSLLSPQSVPAGEMLAAISAYGGDLLREVFVFDLYEGGKNFQTDTKSVGLGLIFQSISRTLTDQEVDGAVRGVVSLLEKKFGISIRE